MRSKEMADVALVGPSRDLMAGPGHVTDAGALVIRKLRQSASLAGNKRSESKRIGSKQKPKGAESQVFQDTSRYTHLLKTPCGHLEAVRNAVTSIFKEHAAEIRETSNGVSETVRQWGGKGLGRPFIENER